MRRLLLLVSVLVFVDTTLYAALTPLLPHFARQLDLSKAGAGVLLASYAAGALIGGLPGGRAAARLGPRRAVLTGLTLMGFSGVAFAFADSFGTLLAARVVQGAGSAFTWAGAFAWLTNCAPAERRGEMIGRTMGAAVFGELFGPVVGVVSGALGRSLVFSAVAGLSVVLGVLTARIDISSELEPVHVTLRSGLRERSFVDGLILLAIGSTLFGVLAVLAPLHLAAAGWGTAAIGGVWLLGAAFEATESPYVGRLSDSHGALTPARLALLASVPVSIALATGAGPALYVPLMVLAGMSYGALFTPSFSLVSEGAERAGLAQGMAFGLMNASWAVGAMGGPAVAGAVAGALGDSVPFLVAAAGCALAFVLFRPRAAARPAVSSIEARIP
ncbi:MAG TPA: MFS transporter [Solirubrobacteraceae bacterium]|nr:MFS transporter [Solirubrobacteraceae bacterium]